MVPNSNQCALGCDMSTSQHQRPTIGNASTATRMQDSPNAAQSTKRSQEKNQRISGQSMVAGV
eukprot:m.513664 g.513664  ORF g.513664 m.513664 type:complete len:63 (-) comp57446_c0_seq3:167-355(-)